MREGDHTLARFVRGETAYPRGDPPHLGSADPGDTPHSDIGSNWLEALHVAHMGYSDSHVKAQVVLCFF